MTDVRSTGRSAAEGRTDGGELFLVLALSLIAAVGLVGIAAAILGVFRPLIVLPLSAALWAELYLLWDPRLRAAGRGRGASGRWWIAAGALATAVTLWNVQLSAEHVFIDRDPGVYLNTAGWLATEGSLVIPARDPVFQGTQRFIDGGPGLFDAGEGTVHFQFLHLLPTLQATAGWFGGDFGLTRVPALLAGLALLAFFALASLILRPALALTAMAALALNLVFTYTARDAYSEPLMLALLAGGMWLLVRALEARSSRRVALAGIVFGTAALTRVDFPVYLIGLVCFLAVEAIRSRDSEVWPLLTRRALPALGAGLAPGLTLGLADGLLRSRGYVEAQGDVLLPLVAIVLVTVVAATGLVVLWPRLQRIRRHLRRWRSTLSLAPAAGILALAAFALVVRPTMFPEVDPELMGGHHATYAAIQLQEGVAVDPDRTYYERSMWWLSWYVGLPVLLAAIAGLAFSALRICRGRAGRAETLLLLVLLAPLALTLARPSAFPDHPWVMRRFVPLAIPGVIVFALLVADRLLTVRLAPRSRIRLVKLAAAALAATAVVSPAAALLPVRNFHAYANFIDPVRLACNRIGPDGVVVVLPPLNGPLPLAFRTLCGIPAAGVQTEFPAAEARAFARRLAASGRRLWLAGGGGDPLPLSGALPDLEVVADSGKRLRNSLTRRPAELVRHRASFVIGPVESAAAPVGFYPPEPGPGPTPWRWLGPDPWLTVVSDGPTWLAFNALSYRRPRTLRLRTPAGEELSAVVGTRPRPLIVGPLFVRTREDLELTVSPPAERGAPRDSRPLSVRMTEPLVVDQPVAAIPVGGFWPIEHDPDGRSFSWMKSEATVEVVAANAAKTADVSFEAAGLSGAETLVVRSGSRELARLRLTRDLRRHTVRDVPLLARRASLELVPLGVRRQPQPDGRIVGVKLAGFDASPGGAG